MSLLTIVKSVAVNVGIEQPTSALTSQTADTIKMVEFARLTAEELARRVDWAALRSSTAISGTGTNDDFNLPPGFARLTQGLAVTVGGAPVRGGVSPDEWNALTPVSGTPRYHRLIGNKISFYPYPTNVMTVNVSWQSSNWCSAGGSVWAADSDTALVPEELIIKGAIWRWRRQLGADFSDYMAEYESALADLAKFDDGVRQP